MTDAYIISGIVLLLLLTADMYALFYLRPRNRADNWEKRKARIVGNRSYVNSHANAANMTPRGPRILRGRYSRLSGKESSSYMQIEYCVEGKTYRKEIFDYYGSGQNHGSMDILYYKKDPAQIRIPGPEDHSAYGKRKRKRSRFMTIFLILWFHILILGGVAAFLVKEYRTQPGRVIEVIPCHSVSGSVTDQTPTL